MTADTRGRHSLLLEIESGFTCCPRLNSLLIKGQTSTWIRCPRIECLPKTLTSLQLHFSSDMKMEALQQSLSPLNWNLIMSGCPLFKSTNTYTRVIVDAYGYLIIIAFISFAIRYLYSSDVPESYSMLIILVFKIWNVLYKTLAVSTIIIIWSGRKGLLRILSRISILLSNEDRKRLHFLSLVLFMYKILVMLEYKSQYIWSLYGNLRGSWREGWWSFLWSIIELILKLHEWELMIICLFITLLKAIHLAETNLMNILDQNLGKVGPKVLYRQLHKILSLKEHFMECVSFLLLFLYCYIFGESIGCILLLCSTMDNPFKLKDERLRAILLDIRNIVILIQNVLLTLYIHHLNRQSKRQLRKMEYEINTKHDHLLKRNVMLLIRESKMYEYRPGDFFVINNELLLSFFSAFVTFTVLFVQLINQYK